MEMIMIAIITIVLAILVIDVANQDRRGRR
jgi:hypothetical protein